MIGKVVDQLGALPADVKPADVGRRVREFLQNPKPKANDEGDTPEVIHQFHRQGLPKWGVELEGQ
ncbi:hypothetical protein ACFYRN_38765 [Streptomyces sp. NPDC005227]|uniref:hypothetical protein n=1 Tax=Streptomyces sp. NPDC005227 TaxID=3364707 RepID=UPI0036D1BCDB